MFFRPNPKPIKKPKGRKYKIAKRSVFKAHGDHPFKTYRRKLTDYQVMVRAEVHRQARLRDPTRAELAFAEMLDAERVLYEREKIFLNGDRYIIADFYFKSRKLVIEIDGSAHDGQKGYEAGRDAWLLRVHGIRTIGIPNLTVLRNEREARQIISASLRSYKAQ